MDFSHPSRLNIWWDWISLFLFLVFWGFFFSSLLVESQPLFDQESLQRMALRRGFHSLLIFKCINDGGLRST